MREIKFVIPEQGEKISTNASELHAELLKLPAEMYVNLYHMMKNKMENSYYVSNGCITTNAIRSNVACL